MSDFVHLHAHSEYSLLDGLSNIKRLTQRAADLGMDTMALTDHGVLYGAIEFYTAAKKAGIKPIIGVEAYVAPGRRDNRTPEGKGYFHTVLLAQNEQGYRNLLKLTTHAHLDGYYYKPRIDRELLAQHKEGLIVTQACISGEVNRRITQKDADGARAAAAWYRDLLGPDNYYLELQLHPEVPELDEINQELVRIGRELNIPLVATNDAHYIDQADAETHRMLRCLGFNTTVQEYCAKNPELDESYFLRSPDQMMDLMRAYPLEAIENTRRIADMCNLELDFGRVQLPEFPLPEGHTPSSFLRKISEEGLVKRMGGDPPKHYWERLHYELDVIDQTGFPLYMLIVWDFVKFARTQNIPCLPRGSAGGSVVLYCLGITDVDPVANKLVFERFLNPERNEMPDIDMDFADSRRSEILDYVANKYGRDRTAQIITFGTLGAKAAVRDVGRVLDIPLNMVDQVAKLIPKLPVGTTITQSLERVPELKKIYDGDTQMKDLIDKARKLEGVVRNVGTHACGVVVSAQPLDELVPLQRTVRDENSVMTAFEGPTLEKVGLLKMDILGLANLSIVASALDYISEVKGEPFTLADIPEDDAATFDLLARGGTQGVFQLESPPMTRYLKELRPTRIQDIYAMVALYRPGPMEQIPKYIEWKNNPSAITYLHPILKPILEDTYGIIVYQEQVLGILMQMAGYTMGKADIVRKAIGKKNRELMAEEEPRFLEGCQQNGLTLDQAAHLWSLIQPFAGYSFNRAHSTLYGLLSYQTAYLKTHYPTEYMAALLSSAAGNIEDVARYVGEAWRLGVAAQRQPFRPGLHHRNNHGRLARRRNAKQSRRIRPIGGQERGRRSDPGDLRGARTGRSVPIS
jgi:DNA polymerase III subunit alpha